MPILSPRVFGVLIFICLFTFSWPTFSKELTGMGLTEKMANNDSIISWIDTCNKYAHSDYDKTAFYAEKVFRRSTEIGYNEGVAHGLMHQGTVHFHKGEYLEALSDLKGALSAFKEGGQLDEIASGNYNIGLLYFKIYDYRNALNYLLEAKNTFQTLNDTDGLSKTANVQGLLYFQTKNYQASLKHFQNAFQLDSAVSDSAAMAEKLGYIAGVYMYQSQFTKAKALFKKCIDINLRFGTKSELALSYNHLGVLYEKIDSFPQARNMYTKQLALLDELNTNDFRAWAYGNMGITFLGEGKYNRAKHWAYRMFGLANSQNDTVVLADACLLLSTCYSDLEQIDSAYLFLDQYVELAKSINKKRMDQLQSGFELRFLLNEKEREVEFVNKNLVASQERNSQLRNRILALIGLVVLLITVFVLIIRVRRQKAKLNMSDLEQQIWRSRINPHIIFNLLNGVQSFFLKKEYDFGLDYLRKFARMMRLLLEKSDERFQTLQEEIDFLKLYAYTEGIRLDNQVEISFKIDEQLEMASCLVPTFICQPYFENAIWHGASGLQEKSRVEVEIRKEAESICWYIRDNGKGIDLQAQPNSQSKSKGPHGMELTKSRLLQLNKSHKKGYSVELKNLNENTHGYRGTEVVVTTPITY